MDRDGEEVGDLAGERHRLGAEGSLCGGGLAGDALEGRGLDRSDHHAKRGHRDDPDPGLPDGDSEHRA